MEKYFSHWGAKPHSMPTSPLLKTSAEKAQQTNISILMPFKSKNNHIATANCVQNQGKQMSDNELTLRLKDDEYVGDDSDDHILTINVAGARHETYQSTLEKRPNTLLGDSCKRKAYYRSDRDEYFFDRHQDSFKAILYFYQSGRIRRPKDIPIDVFLKELVFYQMGKGVIEAFWISEGHVPPRPELLPSNICQRRVWLLMEHTDSSPWARIIAFISVITIVISIASFCLETIPGIQDQLSQLTIVNALNSTLLEEDSYRIDPFFIVECTCVSWFTVEFVLRLLSCPSKIVFIKSFLNIIDFFAIAPFLINMAFFTDGNSTSMSFAVLRVIRLVRVFRIFKLSRHSVGLQILGKTFQASIPQLFLVIFFVMIVLVLFSSAIYFAEQFVEETKFDSIPTAFWFTIVTMTTVGYGDLVPSGPFGKLIGALCALIGVLVLALPVPVIVANFKHFYRQETRLSHMKTLTDENEMPIDISISS